jgi:hypothetical protein
MKRTLLAFVHIEKAAGTTLIYLLRRNYLMQYLDVRPLHARSNGMFTAEDLRTCLRINPFLRCIGGHAVKPFADLERIVADIRYVTLLRDPVQRYLSQYRYWTTALRMNWTFERFLDHEPSHNFQTRKLAGSDDVAEAKRILAERLFVAGVAERFDEFLVTLQGRLRPSEFDATYVRRNVASIDSRSPASEHLERYSDRIRSNNALDLELYRHVVEERLPRQRSEYGTGFEAALQRLRTANAGHDRLDPRLLLDAVCRKAYYEPVTGILRRLRGMPMSGSY